MTRPLEDYIAVPKALPEDFCAVLVGEIAASDWQQATWYSYDADRTVSEPDREPEMLRATAAQQERLTPFVVGALENYQDACGWDSGEPGQELRMRRWLSRISHIRFNRYPAGTLMLQHYDHIQSLFDGKTKGVPILSLVGNLNEEYEGSEFICRDRLIELGTGDFVIFPSNCMFPHAVRETTAGMRYSFVAWAF